MAKTKQQNIQSLKSKKHRKDQSHLHFAMTSKNSVDGFLPTTVAPVLLIIGYCVIVPIGILYKDKNVNTAEAEEIKEIKIEPKAKISTSNIQTK